MPASRAAGVAGDAAFDAGGDEGGLGLEERDGLALHVGAHEGAVGVVVLQEGDQPGGHGDDLLGRDVHVGDAGGFEFEELALVAAGDGLALEGAVLVERGVGLRDDVLFFLVGGEVVDLVGDLAVDDAAVRGLDEAELVDAGVHRKGGNEADVRTFRRFDRADAAVVRGMHVADFEARALAAEAAGAQGAQAALVGQLGQRVGLVHELAQLAAAEEVADDRGEGLRVDELLGGELFGGGVEDRHLLADQPLGAAEADAALVLYEFADGADAAAAEVVDVVQRAFAVAQADEVADGGDEVLLLQRARLVVGGAAEGLEESAELLLDLVAADAAEVVAAGIEEEALEHLPRVGGRGGVAGAQLAVEVLERVVHARGGVLADALEEESAVPLHVHGRQRRDAGRLELLEQVGRHRLEPLDEHRLAVGVLDVGLDDAVLQLLGAGPGDVDFLEGVEQPEELLVGPVSQRAQEGGGQEFPAPLLAVEVHVEQVGGVELHFHPRAAVRDDPERVQEGAVGVDAAFEADAGAAVQLADDHAFGAVDDEGALLGDERDLAHEHGLLADFRLALEAERHVEGRGVGFAFLQAVHPRHLRRRDFVLHEVQRIVPVVALDGERFLEHRLQADIAPLVRGRVQLQQLLVGLGLDLDEIRQAHHILQRAKIDPIDHAVHLSFVTGPQKNETTAEPRRAFLAAGERLDDNRSGVT